jgi:hypothetical protein
VHINAWLDAMKSYLQASNTTPILWVDLVKTYLETRVAQCGNPNLVFFRFRPQASTKTGSLKSGNK